MSTFTWLDYSEYDRQKALEVVRLFAEKGTVDELGIGTVRDAFSNLFFPGTSILHTRARYFFFVPWIYQRLEGREWGSAAEVAAQARKAEIALINELAESDQEGVIGIDARENLKSMPSLAYWQGLEILGFRRLGGGQASFHRRLAHTSSERAVKELRTDDGEPIGRGAAKLWHPGLPPAPPSFPKGATFVLTVPEARFFQDTVREKATDSFLAYLLRHGRDLDAAAFPWQYPHMDKLPPTHRDQLRHAENFSEVMHGAPLLYNLMLSELAGQKERRADYKDRLAEWSGSIESRMSELKAWDRRAMWSIVLKQNPRIPLRTQAFIDAWLNLVCQPSVAKTLSSGKEARALVEHREKAMKGSQARLANRRALERWNGDSGTARLDYRWNACIKQLVNDVLAAA